MAKGKRYYWIKLKDSFMSSYAVNHLMLKSKQDGINYIVLYIMLCLELANTQGRFEAQIGYVTVPYEVEHLQYACRWFSEEEITAALGLFNDMGLIAAAEDGVPYITDFDSFVGCETDYADQKRRQRGQCPQDEGGQSDGQSGGQSGGQSVDNDVDNVHTDIRHKISDIRDKRINKDKELNKNTDNKYSMSEQGSEPCSRPAAVNTPSDFSLILSSGKYYNVSEEDLMMYKRLYPSVNVEQELRSMEGWLQSNPNKRKTASYIKAFVNRWLKKVQDTKDAQPPDMYHQDTRPGYVGNPFADVPD